jgi:exosortase family protein XrtF
MLKNLNPVVILFGKAILLYLVWYVVYVFFLAHDGRLDNFLNANLTNVGAAILQFLGYDVSIREGHNIYIANKPNISIGSPCNGLLLYVTHICFLIVLPSKIRYMLIFAVIGIVSIYSINIVRIIALSLNHLYNPETFDFNHKYVYQIIVYILVGLLWHTWIKKYAHLTVK